MYLTNRELWAIRRLIPPKDCIQNGTVEGSALEKLEEIASRSNACLALDMDDLKTLKQEVGKTDRRQRPDEEPEKDSQEALANFIRADILKLLEAELCT